MGHNREMKLF